MSIHKKTITHYHHPETGKRCPSTTPGAVKKVVKSKKYYGLVNGVARPLHANRAAAIRMLAALRGEAELGEADAGRKFRLMPLADHLADFLLWVRHGRKGRRAPSARQVETHERHVRRAMAGCGWELPADITEESAIRWIDRLRAAAEPFAADKDFYTREEVAELLGVRRTTVSVLRNKLGLAVEGTNRLTLYPAAAVESMAAARKGKRGMSARGVQHIFDSVKLFARWLSRRTLRLNALAELGISPDAERRRARRALTNDEIRRLLEAAAAGPPRRGLSGPDRRRLYLVALSTGFRRSELASLAPASFELDGPSPVVRLSRRADKSKRGASQPLPRAVADELRGWLAGLDPAARVWGGGWRMCGNATDMLRFDLRRAGIPFRTDGEDGPTYVDIHALRHTYIACLERAGVGLKTAMQLARHTDPRFTAKVYGQANAEELGAAADRLCLPVCLPVTVSPGVGSCPPASPAPAPAGAAQGVLGERNRPEKSSRVRPRPPVSG